MNSLSHKNYTATLILTILLGPLGIHRFYVGKAGTGILYFFTLGFLGIGWIIDIIMVATGSFTDKSGAWIKPAGANTVQASTPTAHNSPVPNNTESGTTARPPASGASDVGPAAASASSSAPNSTGTTNPLGRAGQTDTAEKPFYTRWWFITIAALVVLAVISSLGGGGGNSADEAATSVEQMDSDSANGTSRSATSGAGADPEPASPAPEPEVAEQEPERPDETVAQANARETAASYLSFSGFSRTGLIDQLEFEGFTTEEATYGVDAVGVDWNEQALRSAESYLDFSAFSRTGLIDQLEFEGFTTEEATYGVDQVGADWNEQAGLSAQSYLDFSSFSRQGLIDQLIFEGFTQAEAEYGVAQVGY